MTLEELLNKCIQKGWKPFGKDQKFEIWIETLPYKKIRVCLKKPDYDYYVYSYRDLVSKESWLWQFVCENGMVNELYDSDDRAKNYDGYANECDDCYGWDDYGYRLIESALLMKIS